MNQTEMPYQKNSVSLSRNNPKVYIEVDIMLKVELRLPTRQDKTRQALIMPIWASK